MSANLSAGTLPKTLVLLCMLNVIDSPAQQPVQFEVASIKLNNSP
jgi:hypothetical protein